MPVEGRGLGSRPALDLVKDREIGMRLATPATVRKLQAALQAKAKGSPDCRRCGAVTRVRTPDNLVREPDAGNPHVRFDERDVETELWVGLRHRPEAKATGNSYSPILPPPRHVSTLPDLPPSMGSPELSRNSQAGRGSSSA